MKIAIVSQYYAPEAIRIPDTLARGLRARGHEVRVITGYPNYPDGKVFSGYHQRRNFVEKIDGVPVRRVPMFVSHSYNPLSRIVNYISFGISAAAAGRWVRRADVVYVYATQMTPAIGPSIWRVLFRAPFVMHIQDLWPESITGSSMVGNGLVKRGIGAILNPWLRYLYRSAAATVAIAPSMNRMLVERGVPSDRIHTVLNWAAGEVESEKRERVQPKTSMVTAIYAGNLGDHQALDTLIHAANEVKSITNLRVVIVGSGVAEERLRELATSLDAHNVTFRGRVAPENMGEIHSASDFQIVSLTDLPIFDGTIPSKLQASLSQGIPVITAVRGDVKELVRSNELGIACDPEDVQQLASALETASSMSPELRLEMGRSARRFYEATMSIDSGVSKIESILLAAAAPRGSDAAETKIWR